MPLNYSVREDYWKSLGQQEYQISQSQWKSTLTTYWKDWCWSWNSFILVIWYKQLFHWKSSWCWERLRAERREGIRGWDGFISSSMQWIWIWANFVRWWGTDRPGVLQPMGLQRVRHDWPLNNIDHMCLLQIFSPALWLILILSAMSFTKPMLLLLIKFQFSFFFLS